jgi:uncharacterized membrane protein YfcA
MPASLPLALFLNPALTKYAFLASVAFAAGILNAVAGGGSFFSFPALLAVPLPPVNANATNTVALWPGQVASIAAFRNELRTVRNALVATIVCGAIGGIAGAVTLLLTRQETFMRLVPWLLLFATILFAIGGPARKWLDRFRSLPASAPAVSGRNPFSLSICLWLTIVSFYVGYFGAGSGFLILTVLTFSHIQNFHQLNALKVLCTTIANGTAVVTFILARAVHWPECLLMLVFAALGGYFGAHYSRRLNPTILKAIVIVGGFALSIHYFLKPS